MADPTLPNVPQVPGVPPMSSDITINEEPMATSDSSDVSALMSQQWGIYDQGGQLVLQPDSINTVESSSEYNIATFPIELGEFRSFNKVATPRSVRVSMSKGGSLTDRSEFLQAAMALRSTIEIYNVVTPEETHMSMNFMREEQSRSADRGAGLITLDLGLEEIREAGDVQYSDTSDGDGDTTATANGDGDAKKSPTVTNPKSTAAARRVSRGPVQPKKPSRLDDAALAKAGFKKVGTEAGGVQVYSLPLN